MEDIRAGTAQLIIWRSDIKYVVAQLLRPGVVAIRFFKGKPVASSQ